MRAPRSMCPAAVMLAAWSLAGEAGAHYVPGDPDPGRAIYLLPGAALSLAVPLRDGTAPVFMDVGVEVSVHRFVPTRRRMWAQWGYGAFAQAQVGGVLVQPGDSPAPSPHFRLALGGQATFGLLGAHAGAVARTPSGETAGALGVFAGVFLTLGLVSASFQVEAPFAHPGDGARFPAVFAGVATVKWPVTFDRE